MRPTDPGLQPQRTALAWQRTGLAVLVNALIVLRSGFHLDQPLLLGLGALLMAAAAGSVACGAWRARSLQSGHGHAAPPRRLILATVAVACLACLAGLTSLGASLGAVQ